MRRCFFLIILAALLCGCGTPAAESSYSFYYVQELHASDISSDLGSKNVLIPEQHPVMGNASLCDILRAYLKGPANPLLQNPFPKKLEILSAEYQDNGVTVLFNDEISNLSGIDLTLVCAGIAKTCGDLTGCSFVTLQGEEVAINNVKSITIAVDSLIFEENHLSPE